MDGVWWAQQQFKLLQFNYSYIRDLFNVFDVVCVLLALISPDIFLIFHTIFLHFFAYFRSVQLDCANNCSGHLCLWAGRGIAIASMKVLAKKVSNLLFNSMCSERQIRDRSYFCNLTFGIIFFLHIFISDKLVVNFTICKICLDNFFAMHSSWGPLTLYAQIDIFMPRLISFKVVINLRWEFREFIRLNQDF